MNKFALDYGFLDTKLNEKKAYRLSDVQNRIERVGFDVVRFTDGDNLELWKVEKRGDDEVIVAMYDDNSETVKESSWDVKLDKTAGAVNFFYKGEPITKVAADELGIAASELPVLCRNLPVRLAEDAGLVTKLVGNLPAEQREALFKMHPELRG